MLIRKADSQEDMGCTHVRAKPGNGFKTPVRACVRIYSGSQTNENRELCPEGLAANDFKWHPLEVLQPTGTEDTSVTSIRGGGAVPVQFEPT